MDAPEYYKLRLEHTIQHLHQATRLIYFVSGAIVAMFYFVIEKMKDSPSHRTYGIALLLLLGLVNVIHALLIRVQANWYRAFDEKLAESVKAGLAKRGNIWVEKATREKISVSASGLWSALHWVVAVAAFAGGVYAFCAGNKF